MVDRYALRRTLNGLLPFLVVVTGCYRMDDVASALRAGSVAPPALAASSPTAVRATWALDGRELVRCRNSARELRRLQARFGGRVEIAVVAFEADPASVESFLRSERVHATVRYLKARDRKAARGVERPALYVVRGGTVAAVFLGVPFDDTRSIESRDVESRVASLLGGSGASGGVGIHPSS